MVIVNKWAHSVKHLVIQLEHAHHVIKDMNYQDKIVLRLQAEIKIAKFSILQTKIFACNATQDLLQ